MRTFIAVELPVAVQQHVRVVQQKVQGRLAQVDSRPCFNWIPPANTHITLRFLGETNEQQRDRIVQGLATLCAQEGTFSLSLSGLDCFPNFRAPRIIWQGIHGDLPALARLQAPVEVLARAVGFTAEERPFSPHLTLARARRDAQRQALAGAGRILERLAAGELVLPAVRFDVAEIHLMRSELLPGGARYTSLASFRLEGA